MGNCKYLRRGFIDRCDDTGNECTCECMGREIANNGNHDELMKQVVELTEENLKLLDNIEHLKSKNQVLVETILEHKEKQEQLEAKVAVYAETICQYKNEVKQLREALRRCDPLKTMNKCPFCNNWEVEGHTEECTWEKITKQDNHGGS